VTKEESELVEEDSIAWIADCRATIEAEVDTIAGLHGVRTPALL